MCMDIHFYMGDPNGHKLSPRQIEMFHPMMMACVRRDIAMRTSGMALACGVGFGGDKKGVFKDWMNSMMERIVFLSAEESREIEERTEEEQSEIDEFMMNLAKSAISAAKTKRLEGNG